MKPQAGAFHSQWWQLGLVLLPGVVACGIMAWMATATPIVDDFDVIVQFAVHYTLAPTAGAKLSVLMESQVGPYRLIFDHLLVMLQLAVLGHLSLPMLVFIGNLALVGSFGLLAVNTLGDRLPAQHSILLLLPVSLLWFGLNYAETVDWAMCGLQQTSGVFFALLAVHGLVRPQRRATDAALASFAGVLACTANANGVILWPIGFLYLLLEDRRISRMLIWSAGLVASCGIYLYHYRPGGPLVVSTSIFAKAVFFIAFCGSAMENMHHRPVPHISLLIGVVALLTFCHALYTRYDRRNPFFVYSVLWVLLSGVVVANARIILGMDVSLASRYKLYTDFLLIFCYEYLLDYLLKPGAAPARAGRVRYALTAAFFFALVVNIGGDIAGAHLLSIRRQQVDSAMTSYIDSNGAESPLYRLDDTPTVNGLAERARQETNEAVRLGIYRPVRP